LPHVSLRKLLPSSSVPERTHPGARPLYHISSQMARICKASRHRRSLRDAPAEFDPRPSAASGPDYTTRYHAIQGELKMVGARARLG